ncbi:MAG: hypothetical protein AAB262_10305 [Elusimicrobiota bacterium]
MLKTGQRNFNFLSLIAVAILVVGLSNMPAFAAGQSGHAPALFQMTNDLPVAAPTPTPDVLQDQRLRGDNSTEFISAGDLALMQNQHLGAIGGLADDDPSFGFARFGAAHYRGLSYR